MATVTFPDGIIVQYPPTKTLQTPGAGFDAEPPVEDPRLLVTSFSSQRVVVIEGDSWFNYPVPFATGIDEVLRVNFNYTFYRQRFSHAGDTLENMILGPGWNTVLGAVAAAQPKAVLFSGGGNDIAGAQFISFLNHVGLTKPPLRISSFGAVLAESFEPCIRKMSADVGRVSTASKIFMHGYAHAIPDGRYLNLAFARFGPWLKPSFDIKGWALPDSQPAVAQAIDLFNDMLQNLEKVLPNFIYVDVRGVANGPADWANELHLNNPGFVAAATIIHNKIESIYPGW